MKPDATLPAIQPGDAHLKVCLAYPDIAHERLGRKYCERLAESLAVLGPMIFSEWKFEMLAMPAMGEMAAAEALNASLVLIVADGTETLPASVKSWVELWSARPGAAHRVVVVLLSELPGCPLARWTDYEYFEARMRASGAVLVVYASGLAPDEADVFSLAEARRVTPDGLAMIESLAEAAALRPPARSPDRAPVRPTRKRTAKRSRKA